MKVRPLVIDDEALAKIKACMIYADDHVQSYATMMQQLQGKLPPPGDDPGHVVDLQFGYRCVFTFDEQQIGHCRHLSVSVPPEPPGSMPSPEAMDVIAAHFGFLVERDKIHLTLEPMKNGNQAIHYLQETKHEPKH